MPSASRHDLHVQRHWGCHRVKVCHHGGRPVDVGQQLNDGGHELGFRRRLGASTYHQRIAHSPCVTSTLIHPIKSKAGSACCVEQPGAGIEADLPKCLVEDVIPLPTISALHVT